VKPAPHLLFGVAASLFVVAGVGAGILIVGGPGHARGQRLDDLRLDSLRMISSEVDRFEQKHHALPQTLEGLDAGDAGGESWRDPETKAPYEYRRTGAASYEMCARFAVASDQDEDRQWRHGIGRSCFELSVDAPAH
jgi:hypothetical protein